MLCYCSTFVNQYSLRKVTFKKHITQNMSITFNKKENRKYTTQNMLTIFIKSKKGKYTYLNICKENFIKLFWKIIISRNMFHIIILKQNGITTPIGFHPISPYSL